MIQSGLLTPSVAYKPFRYPWAYEAWRKQQQIHWLPEEVPMADDVKDWRHKLTAAERNLLSQIFRFFTQADVEVNNCVARLSGTVPTGVERLEAMQVARATRGVCSVHDDLRVAD